MSIDVLPSTFDGAYSDEDGVLSILKNARERYAAGAINGAYVLAGTGSVCAVGAFGTAVGLNEARDFGGSPSDLIAQVEILLREDAKEAIRLLEKAALTLFPEVGEDLTDSQFAIELLNEEPFFGEYSWTEDSWSDDDENDPEQEFWEERNKVAVLACYDYAIVRRHVSNVREYLV